MDATKDTPSALDERRYLVKPITLLLLSNIHSPSKTTLHSHVREVLFAYMKAASVHEEAASTLLRSSDSECVRAMIDFLIRFAQAHATKYVSVGDKVVTSLLSLLADKELYQKVYSIPPNNLLRSVTQAFKLLLNTNHGKAVDFSTTPFSTPFTSAVEEITNALTISDRRHLRSQAVKALWSLSAIKDDVVRQRIGTPKLLGELSKILNEDHQAEDANIAAAILGNLATVGGQQICQAVLSIPTALEGLVDALTSDKSPQLQAGAARALRILTSEGGEGMALRISSIPESLARFVHALTKAANPELQRQAAGALRELANQGGPNLCSKISDAPAALEELVGALEMDTNPNFQAEAAGALGVLTDKGGNSIALRISSIPQSLERLAHALTKASNPELQKQAVRTLAVLAVCGNPHVSGGVSNNRRSFPQLTGAMEEGGNIDSQCNPAVVSSGSATCTTELHLKLIKTTGCIENLLVLANDSVNSPEVQTSALAIWALTSIDFPRGRKISLKSADSFLERGYAELLLGLYKESLEDLNEAWRIQPAHWKGIERTLVPLTTVKARLGDFQGALIDATSLIERVPISFAFQERGVLRCMMGDLPAALRDLDEAVRLEPDGYECLKHRGYVKFLMGDEIGGRADAERALEVKPSRVDFTSYGRHCLGASSVEYMGFKLR